MKSHETAFHVINCHVPVCHAVVPSRKWTMWLFRYVIVISYKCSITSTEVAPYIVIRYDWRRLFKRKAGLQDSVLGICMNAANWDVSCMTFLRSTFQLLAPLFNFQARKRRQLKLFCSFTHSNLFVVKVHTDSPSW